MAYNSKVAENWYEHFYASVHQITYHTSNNSPKRRRRGSCCVPAGSPQSRFCSSCLQDTRTLVRGSRCVTAGSTQGVVRFKSPAPLKAAPVFVLWKDCNL